MRPGHPYLTEDLDRLRATQRRTLRMIPDEVLKANSLGPVGEWRPQVDDLDRPFVEHELRELAAHQVTSEALAKLLKAWSVQVGRSELAKFAARSTERPGNSLEASRTRILDHLADREADDGSIPSVGMVAVELGELILLLAWADVIADDEYADPRLS